MFISMYKKQFTWPEHLRRCYWSCFKHIQKHTTKSGAHNCGSGEGGGLHSNDLVSYLIIISISLYLSSRYSPSFFLDFFCLNIPISRSDQTTLITIGRTDRSKTKQKIMNCFRFPVLIVVKKIRYNEPINRRRETRCSDLHSTDCNECMRANRWTV